MTERLKQLDEVLEEDGQIQDLLSALGVAQAHLQERQLRLNVLRPFLNRGITHTHSVGWVAGNVKR